MQFMAPGLMFMNRDFPDLVSVAIQLAMARASIVLPTPECPASRSERLGAT